jgi:ABC-type transport system substrate-binding protein
MANATSPNYPDISYSTYSWVPDEWYYSNWLVGSYLGLGSTNIASYVNPQVDNLLHQADQSTNQTQRAALYDQVAHIVYNDAPYIWVATLKNSLVYGVPVLGTNVHAYVLDYGFWESDFSPLYLTS